VQNLSPPVTIGGLLELLDQLREAGISFDLARGAGRFQLEWSRAPTPAGLAALAPWLPWLEHVAVGRYTGHAPAVCSVCGELAFVPIVTTSGTRMGRKSTGWAKCRMSNGWYGERVRRGRYTAVLKRCPGEMVIREVDFEGVARVKPPGIPTLKRWKERQQ
jgi:hypothetical protein